MIKLSGTVTVLSVLGWFRPEVAQAQEIGTMQVSAEVTRADAAWNGLTAAQHVARDFATTRVETIPRATTIGLVRVSVEMAAHPSPVAASQSSVDADRPPVVVVQYLRN